jgi:hypothetical protein
MPIADMQKTENLQIIIANMIDKETTTETKTRGKEIAKKKEVKGDVNSS